MSNQATTQQSAPLYYEIIDLQRKMVIGKAKTLRAAYNKCDRLDQVYGAVRYGAKAIYAPKAA